MKRIVSLPETICLITCVLVAGIFLYLHSTGPYTTPEHTIASLANSAAGGSFDLLREAGTTGWSDDFTGHFGELQYRHIRDTYQRAIDLATPRLQEIRSRAIIASNSEYERIHQRVNDLGRAAFSRLGPEQKMELTADRGKFDNFVFHEGFQALTASERASLGTEDQFRNREDRSVFAQHVAWNLLSAADREALGSPATMSPQNTPEKLAFLVRTGKELLAPGLRKEIEAIPVADLNDPRAFMLKYGQPIARVFLRNAAVASTVSDLKCRNVAVSGIPGVHPGGLIPGRTAVCSGRMSIRGTSVLIQFATVKAGFDWRIDRLAPELFEIGAAYPPVPRARAEQPEQPPQPTQQSQAVIETPESHVQFPESMWQPHSNQLPLEDFSVLAILQTLASYSRLGDAIPVATVAAVLIALFIFVMTVNYRRNRNEGFSPDWLDSEHELSSVTANTIWGRMHARLTTRRLLQLKISWFLSRRKLYAVAFEDVHAVVWRRHINWLPLVLALLSMKIYLPAAVLLTMLGLEAKIYSVRLVGTQYAQFPLARLSVSSFHRKQFHQLFEFYRNVQMMWARVRSSSTPTAAAALPISAPDIDNDFYWGRPVWVYVLLISAAAFVQSIIGNIAFDDYVFAPLYLALPVAASFRSRRTGFWVALLGMVMLLTIKAPSAILQEYFEVFLVVILIAAAAGRIAVFATSLASLCPVLWIAFVAYRSGVLAQDMALFARVAIASAMAIVVCWADRSMSWGPARPAPSASARAAAA